MCITSTGKGRLIGHILTRTFQKSVKMDRFFGHFWPRIWPDLRPLPKMSQKPPKNESFLTIFNQILARS